MRLKTTVFVLAVVLGSFVAVQGADAQDDHLVTSPLNVTTLFSYDLGADCQGGEGLVVQLRYAGAQPLRGYLVRLALADPLTGRSFGEQSLQEIRDSREPMIPSGAEWTRNVCTMPRKIAGSPTSVTATVDVLKFADGSIWGPPRGANLINLSAHWMAWTSWRKQPSWRGCISNSAATRALTR
jgi:hypothetical protein